MYWTGRSLLRIRDTWSLLGLCVLLLLVGCNDLTWLDPQTAELNTAVEPPSHPPAPIAAIAPNATRATPSPTARPIVAPGTGTFVNPAPATTASVQPGNDGTVTFNFVGADIRDVMRELLGDQLHLNYVVDSRVQGTITAQTGSPLARTAVLPTLGAILRANGFDLVLSDGVYRVVQVADAARSGLGAEPTGNGGRALRVVSLRYVSAAELKGVLDPFLPPGAAVQTDEARNVLLVSGTQSDFDGISSLVRQFDVDWLAGTSFALHPLHVGNAADVAAAVNQLIGDRQNGPLAGLVRIVPLPRFKAILVIASQRRYLDEVQGWIDRIDYGEAENIPRLFEYRVQNSRAADLAAVLNKLLANGSVSTILPTTAPGTTTTTLGGSQQNSTGFPSATAGNSVAGLSSSTPGLTSTSAPGTTTTSPTTTSTTPGQTTGGSSTSPSANGSTSSTSTSASLTSSTNDTAANGSGIGTSQGNNNLELPPVRIVADEKNNALVIFARPSDYHMIEDLIRQLDVVPLQVLIQATIAEVTLNDSLAYGLQYYLTQGNNRFNFTAPTPNQVTPSNNGAGGVADISAVYPGFNYLLSTTNSRVILNAIAQVSHVNVVSSPELLVLDHQTASLQVGDQVPIITTSSQSTVTNTSDIINSVAYQQTGVLLKVTPRVNNSGLITLDLDQEVSDVSATTTSNIDSPTITNRHVVSSVVVEDGQTLALAGLILDNQTNTKAGIPVLSSIPVVGSLFGTTTNSRARTELIVFLSPRIVRNSVDARAMTDELRDRMRLVKPIDPKSH